MHASGHDNPTFVGDSNVYSIPGEFRRSITQFYPGKSANVRTINYFPPAQFQVRDEKEKESQKEGEKENQRDSWGKGNVQIY